MTTFLGLFAAFVGVPMQTMIQSETPVDMRGKVFGLQNNAVNIALSLPLALAGIAETLVGLKPVLLALAALAVAGGILTGNIGKNRPSSKIPES
jgi:sugar phosphate permease